jgi:hypothetical protein
MPLRPQLKSIQLDPFGTTNTSVFSFAFRFFLLSNAQVGFLFFYTNKS